MEKKKNIGCLMVELFIIVLVLLVGYSTYNNLNKPKENLAETQEFKDWEKWLRLNKYNQDVSMDDLYVYIEKNGKLHINGKCFDGKDESLFRVKFDSLKRIDRTCNTCVSRRFVDFIYKKVNDGVYDLSAIDVTDE